MESIRHLLRTSVCLSGLLITCAQAHADVVLDGSTGSSGALSGPTFQITESLGQRAGNNLLHSFSQFSLTQNQTAVFSGDAAIQNIISRVTGGDISTIDGTLQSTIPNANLFLLNPAGIIIGENAVLDIGGALHLSTASELQFVDGTRLPTNTSAPASLTTANPTAFGFLNSQQGSIEFQGTDLNQPTGQFVGLTAASVSFDNADVTIAQGRVEIATTQQTASISIQAGSYQIAPGNRSGGVSLTDGSDVITDAGTIRIQSGELVINRSQLNVNNSTMTDGGRVEIQTSGDVLLTGDNVGGFSSGGRIRAHTTSSGNSAGILINAGGDITIDNGFLVGSIVLGTTTRGASGGVVLQAAGDILINNAIVSTRTEGPGHGGDIVLQSGRDMNINDAAIDSSSDTNSLSGMTLDTSGDSGDITFVSNRDITFTDSLIDTRTTGLGNVANAGDFMLRGEAIRILEGTRFEARAFANLGNNIDDSFDFTTLQGNGGLDIRARTLLLEGSGFNLTSGNTVFGGQVSIIADESVTLRASQDATSLRSFILASGDADLLIDTPILRVNNATINIRDTGFFTTAPHVFTVNVDQLILENGGNIRLGYTGDNGSLNINATQSVLLTNINADNSNDVTIELDTGSFDAIGDGASLFINTPVLTLQGDEVRLSTSGFFRSLAGDININVATLNVLDGAGIDSSEAIGRSDGFIRINATEAVNILSTGTFDTDDNLPTSYIGVQRDSSFIVGSSDPDSTGSIFINAPLVNLVGGEIIASNTTTGTQSGDITINASTLLLQNASQIQSNNSASDTQGQITLNVRERIELSGSDQNGDVSRITSQGNRGGNGGTINISTSGLVVDGGSISASTSTADVDTGAAGDVVINVGTLELLNGGQLLGIVTNARGGDIVVNATESVFIDGFRPSSESGFILPSGMASAAREGGVGDGGLITITTPLLGLSNRGTISTEARGAGDAGDVLINADRIQLTDSATILSSGTGTGNGGSITVNALNISLDASGLSVESQNQGDAGSLNLFASESLRLVNNAFIRARVTTDQSSMQAVLNGGDIKLIVGDLISLRDSEISTLVDSGTGNGGDIFIDPIFVVLNNSRIVADAQGGNGGNIDLISDFFFNLNSVLSASSALGLAGQISIVAPEVNLTSQLAVQSADFLGDENLRTQSCNAIQQQSQSSFIIRSRTLVEEAYALLP